MLRIAWALIVFSSLAGCTRADQQNQKTTAQGASVAPPAYIILIRHGEEAAGANDPNLGPDGLKRAQDLVPYITTDTAMTNLGTPVALFATRTTKHDTGVRTQETLAPLSEALKLRVQTPYLGSHYAELAIAILSNPDYSGKTILISWNHENIPQLTAALGVNPAPDKWKGKIYDQVYIISYKNGVATLRTSRYGAQ